MSGRRTCDICGASFKANSAIAREKNLQHIVKENPNICYSCLIEEDLKGKIHMANSFLEFQLIFLNPR